MPGTPPGIFFDLLKERSIYCMRSEIETSQLATLMQTEISKFCSFTRTAASELELLGNDLKAAMEILMEDADSWLLFASFQHFHPRKVNVTNLIAYDTMRIIVNFFNDPTFKAEFEIDLQNLKKILDYIKTYHSTIENNDSKAQLIPAKDMEMLFSSLFAATLGRFSLFSTVVLHAIYLQINSSLYHARLVYYIRKNLFDLL